VPGKEGLPALVIHLVEEGRASLGELNQAGALLGGGAEAEGGRAMHP